jgi:site-specific DNA-methyltransferase (adenine-specific)
MAESIGLELNKIYHMDNRDGLPLLPEKSINLIIADPPYFEVKGEFDFVWKSFDEYLLFMEGQAQLYKRVLVDNGTLFVWGMDRKIAYVQTLFDKYFSLCSTLVWEKPSIANEWDTRRTFPERGQERLLMYCNEEDLNLTDCVFYIRDYIRTEILKAKGKISFKDINTALGTATNGGGVASACLSLDKAEPGMITKEMYEKLQAWCNPVLRKEYEILRKEYEEKRRPFNNYLALTDVLRFSRVYNPVHPTQKPEDLTRALILTCSRPDDLVCVPFVGSGTECAMSAKEKRKFIGFETNAKHVETARNRVNVILSQPELFA